MNFIIEYITVITNEIIPIMVSIIPNPIYQVKSKKLKVKIREQRINSSNKINFYYFTFSLY